MRGVGIKILSYPFEPNIPWNSSGLAPILRNYYLNLSSEIFSSLIFHHLKNIYSLLTTVAVCLEIGAMYHFPQ